MKVSEITDNELADYLRLEYADLTEVEKVTINNLLTVAKSFIKSYTGLKDIIVTDEIIGVGDGTTTTFQLANVYIEAKSQIISVNGEKKDIDTNYTINYDTGKISFLQTPMENAIIKGSYKALPSDKYEDFISVVYILVQDMYDNRSLYVDKANLNKVVEAILGLHSVNLL
ncbi:MAG: hypothetical protein AB9836_07605 [Aminipila sp.]